MYAYNHAPASLFFLALVLWTIPWKVYAVWLAAKAGQKRWFVALIILNTASILELIYIFKVQKKTWKEATAEIHAGWNELWDKTENK